MKKEQCTIEQYMKKDVVTIQADATAKEAILLMIKSKTNGAVVVDDDMHVTGILSSWDIIKHIVPDYLEVDSTLAHFEAQGLFISRTNEIAGDLVEKFMTKNVRTAKVNASLIEAAALLSNFHIRQLPIVDDDNILIGYINRTDIKNAAGDVF